MECPKCGGPCWDNRGRKEQGQMKPNAPDFKCKDADCGWKQWPSKGEARKTARVANTPQRNGAKWTWPALSNLYARSLAIAAQHVKAHVPNATPAEYVAAGAAVFIAATRDGVSEPKPQREPQRDEPPYDDDPPY